MEEIKIEASARGGTRLDLYIAMNQNVISRSEVKRKISKGEIYVNNKVEYRPHYKVLEGDSISIKNINNEGQINDIKPVNILLDVVYEDADLLVVNKPSGLVTHPASGHTQDTLMNGVLYHYKEMKNVGDNIRSGLIHRLDKDTSGVILIGKTNLGLWHYSKMFAEKKAQKTYAVIVKGDAAKVFGQSRVINVTSYHGRNKKNRKKYSSQDNYEGKMANTEFELVKTITKNGQKYSFILAHPKTGRTHQIRVHLSEKGIPVLGDPIYGKNEYKRLMLHAWRIVIPNIAGNDIKFEAPLPKEFSELIDE